MWGGLSYKGSDIPLEYVPAWLSSQQAQPPYKARPLERCTRDDFLGKPVVWLPEMKPQPWALGPHKYHTPGKRERLGTYAQWVQPKVGLVASSEHAGNKSWVQCRSTQDNKLFYFPKSDLYLPTVHKEVYNGRSRAAIVADARGKCGEYPRKERMTLSVLQDLMATDKGVYTKLKVVKALYQCFGDVELSLEYLRVPDGVESPESAMANNWMAPPSSASATGQANSYNSTAGAFQVGELIQARWNGLGLWYPGKIERVYSLGDTYRIRYDDGMFEDNVEESMIRKRR